MFEVCKSCIQCCFIIRQNCISCNCVSAVDVIVYKLWYSYYSSSGMILRNTRLMSYASPTVTDVQCFVLQLHARRKLPRRRQTWRHFSGISRSWLFAEFFGLFWITVIQLCFILLSGFSVWCLILTQTTTITSVKKKNY